MKLSEAIRLGAAMKPQAFRMYFMNGGSCALGAAIDALGGNKDDECLIQYHALLRSMNAQKCPECGSAAIDGGYLQLIPHLNDMHKWSRERIADFVELHEPLPIESAEQLDDSTVEV